MALIRWQPFREIDSLRRQFDQMFDELTDFAPDMGASEYAWAPAIELQDQEDSLLLKAEVPGVDKQDLDIRVGRDSVAISGETHQETKDSVRSEFRYGKFQRMVGLPTEIKQDAVEADFKDGILTLKLPKVEEAQPQIVKIELGGEQPEALGGSETENTNA